MSPGLGIGLIIGLIIIGILYWEECRKKSAAVDDIELPWGLALFIIKTREEMQEEVDAFTTELRNKGVQTIECYEYFWGVELECDTGFRVFICNPAIEILTFDASTLMIDERLSADQVLSILSKHSGRVSEVHLYQVTETDGGNEL